jgi:hypothetical protein
MPKTSENGRFSDILHIKLNYLHKKSENICAFFARFDGK